jgi:hypothetical protein
MKVGIGASSAAKVSPGALVLSVLRWGSVLVLALLIGGCAFLDQLGQGRPGGSGKILLVPEEGPVLLSGRARDQYTCGGYVKVCTQVGTTRFSCECAR